MKASVQFTTSETYLDSLAQEQLTFERFLYFNGAKLDVPGCPTFEINGHEASVCTTFNNMHIK